jgi:hypothetical protein
MLCIIFCGSLNNLRVVNPAAGRAATFEAIVFFIAQIAAGLFNLWLGEDKGNGSGI